jgi:hypothetical protein
MVGEHQDKKIIFLNENQKKSCLSLKFSEMTGRCMTANCDGSGNTRKQYKSHASSKYCPLNKAQKKIKNLNVRIKHVQDLPDKKDFLDLSSQNQMLETKIRTLENEKYLGNVKYFF